MKFDITPIKVFKILFVISILYQVYILFEMKRPERRPAQVRKNSKQMASLDLQRAAFSVKDRRHEFKMGKTRKVY